MAQAADNDPKESALLKYIRERSLLKADGGARRGAKSSKEKGKRSGKEKDSEREKRSGKERKGGRSADSSSTADRSAKERKSGKLTESNSTMDTAAPIKILQKVSSYQSAILFALVLIELSPLARLPLYLGRVHRAH